MDSEVRSAVAAALWQAELSGGQVDFPSRRFPALSWDEARAIARAVDGLRRADDRNHIGYKLGWTSEVMRRSLGIEQPNWGTLWAHQVIGDVLEVGRLRHPKVEPEIVYRCAQTLSGPDVVVDDVVAAADGWALGHEVVHPRFSDFGFTWLDNTADNSSSQAVAVGEFVNLEDVDPATVEIDFSNEREQRHGNGAAAMGSPVQAVVWLVKALSEEGFDLEPGQIVFTGGLAAPFDVEPGTEYQLSSNLLPSVSIQVASEG